jgi:hypothetical protein
MAGELQDLIDGQISQVIGGVLSGGVLSLPKVVVDVSETLRIENVRGFRFGGEAPLATELRWQGDEESPMFILDRCQDILLEDFSIAVGPGKKLVAAAWIQNTPLGDAHEAAVRPNTSHVMWRNVRVRGEGRLARGFHVRLVDVDVDEEDESDNEPENDKKNDHHSFHDVTVSGYTEAAFTLEGRNAKNLGFDRCHCIGQMEGGRRGNYAIDTSTHPNHGGAFHWSSGSVIGHGRADFRIGDRNQTIKIDGVYSEKSARMLEMPDYGPGASAACPVLLENYRFAANNPGLVDKDGVIIDCEAAGPLSIIACKMGSNIEGQELRIRYAPNPKPGAFIFLGNAITNDGPGDVFTGSKPTFAYIGANLRYRGGEWGPL